MNIWTSVYYINVLKFCAVLSKGQFSTVFTVGGLCAASPSVWGPQPEDSWSQGLKPHKQLKRNLKSIAAVSVKSLRWEWTENSDNNSKKYDTYYHFAVEVVGLHRWRIKVRMWRREAVMLFLYVLDELAVHHLAGVSSLSFLFTPVPSSWTFWGSSAPRRVYNNSLFFFLPSFLPVVHNAAQVRVVSRWGFYKSRYVMTSATSALIRSSLTLMKKSTDASLKVSITQWFFLESLGVITVCEAPTSLQWLSESLSQWISDSVIQWVQSWLSLVFAHGLRLVAFIRLQTGCRCRIIEVLHFQTWV